MPIHDHPVGEIVRGQRNGHAIAQNDPDSILAHPATELRAHDRAGVGLDLELPTGKYLRHDAVELYMVIACQVRPPSYPNTGGRAAVFLIVSRAERNVKDLSTPSSSPVGGKGTIWAAGLLNFQHGG